MKRADKLVMMANQIARNLAIQGEDKAIAGTAEHIAKFWDPRMRAQVSEHFAAGGEGLSLSARKAVEKLLLSACSKQAHEPALQTSVSANSLADLSCDTTNANVT